MSRRLRIAEQLLERRINGLAVVAEAVRRRHNMSAVLRSAEGFGLNEAHMVCGHFRPSPGASKGSERWLDLHLHENVRDCAAVLKERGFKLYVCDLDEDAVAPWEVPVEQPIALLFGSELVGVSEAAREVADGFIKVPMLGVTQSLNVSAAAAVVLHEVARRRAQVPGAIGITGPPRDRLLARVEEEEHIRRHVYYA